ncbi:hypothetical protein Btru_009598 [Bulinus truncatus]|nr:hypothetical protein Btru_009598 [Bulinus truncatus]
MNQTLSKLTTGYSTEIEIIQERSGNMGARSGSPTVKGDNLLTTEVLKDKRLPVSEMRRYPKMKESAVQMEGNKSNILVEGTKLKTCSNTSSLLAGRFNPTLQEFKPGELASKFPMLENGGTYSPSACAPDQKVAIIVPYRDRWKHLHTLLAVLIPMLMRQNVAFTIFVIEQELPETFNKGVLFNVGYIEALNLSSYDCFIFHDVDMVPVDDRNIYRCSSDGPTHLAAFVDKFKYKTFYEGLFGGAVAFTKEQFRRINGASNIYFGWGAEDDDLRDRVISRNYTIVRRPYGAYDMIKHSRSEAGWTPNKDRFKVFSTRLKRQHIDGLNSVVYKRRRLETLPMYTWIKVSVNRTQILQRLPLELRQGDKPDLSYRQSITVRKLISNKT